MIRIAYAEDDRATAGMLARYIEKYAAEKGLEITAEHFPNAERLIYNYTHRYDLLLLDIQLGNMTGMEAAQSIRKLDTTVQIIFITSLVQYAVKGYEVDALDFVVKPVTYAQFALKMDKAMRILRRSQDVTLPVPTDHGTKFLSSRDISCIEVSDHDLLYHTADGAYRARGSLGKTEAALAGQPFVRASVSHLVNLAYVTGVNGSVLTLRGGEEVWISRSRKRDVQNALAQYLGGLL